MNIYPKLEKKIDYLIQKILKTFAEGVYDRKSDANWESYFKNSLAEIKEIANDQIDDCVDLIEAFKDCATAEMLWRDFECAEYRKKYFHTDRDKAEMSRLMRDIFRTPIVDFPFESCIEDIYASIGKESMPYFWGSAIQYLRCQGFSWQEMWKFIENFEQTLRENGLTKER